MFDSDRSADGQAGMTIGPENVPEYEPKDQISIVNDYLWHGGVGSPLACSVSNDPAVKAYIAANFPKLGPCPKAGRTLTRVDARVTTFVGADGARGAALIVLPSSSAADDGKISVLTCRLGGQLTTAICGTIVADWAARVRGGS